MVNPFLNGPVPPYNNPPIEPQFYIPQRFVISDVTLGQTTLVTTLLDMDYVIGQEIRLLIPSSFGCYQLNEQTGLVISIPMTNQVEVSINSSQNVNAFYGASLATTLPEIVAIGDVNSGVINSQGRMNTGLTIPGSFSNISPI